jgi:hypothetical protein
METISTAIKPDAKEVQPLPACAKHERFSGRIEV